TARRLSGRHRVLRIDLAGHGRSDAPPHDLAPYRLERCSAQLARVARELALPPAHWLGYSMGGRAALGLAVWHPQVVRSLLPVAGGGGLADPAERAARIRADEELALAIERDGLSTFVERWMAQPLFASQRRLGAAALRRARAERLRNRPHALALCLR